jgi:hypothetical protein
VADWVTISGLAIAGGTLVLAMATFGSVRSTNQVARVAEQSLLAGIRRFSCRPGSTIPRRRSATPTTTG